MARGLHLSACPLHFSVEVMGPLAAFKELIVLIITAVFPGEMLSNLEFQIAIDEKRWTNEMLRVPIYRVLKRGAQFWF